jgi:hypothetical protein
MARIRKNVRFGSETLERVEAIREADYQTTGIRPTETAVFEAAIAEFWRRKVGRRVADARPVRRRSSR